MLNGNAVGPSLTSLFATTSLQYNNVSVTINVHCDRLCELSRRAGRESMIYSDTSPRELSSGHPNIGMWLFCAFTLQIMLQGRSILTCVQGILTGPAIWQI